MISIVRTSGAPYYRQVYEQFARAIEQGTYREGDRLPSIRAASADLNVSRNTIEQAYQLLVDEGLVVPRQGSGYTVCELKEPVHFEKTYSLEYRAKLAELRTLKTDMPPIRYDFCYDAADASSFPFNEWSRISRDVLLEANARQICRYTSFLGIPCLRSRVADMLSRTRGLDVATEQVAIMPTTRIALEIILQLFDAHTTSVACENPGFSEFMQACTHGHFKLIPVSMFPTPTWEEFVINDGDARLLYVTPADQYPTNAVMSLEDRKRLLAWAAQKDAYIIEDNYCLEFDYESRNIPSMYALDTEGRVISIGTFSKTFAPGLTMSYIALPPELMLRLHTSKHPVHSPVPWQTQAAMARFIEKGLLEPHLRKVQTMTFRKHRALKTALERYMGDRIEVHQHTNGLHVLVRTVDNRRCDELVALAEAAGVRVYSTTRCWYGTPPADWDYVLLGFAGIAETDINAGIRTLATAWFG